MHRGRLGSRRGGVSDRASVSDPSPESSRAREERGWGRHVRPRRRRTPKPRVRARAPAIWRACARRRGSPRDPLREARAAAGGHSEGDLQGGGGPVEGRDRSTRARREKKAAVPAEPRAGPPARPGPASRPRSPPAPAPLTGRARPPLATGLRGGLPGAVGRGGRRQLVRLDDHGGGSGRPAQLSVPPAAPLTRVPCSPRPLREGRSHRPTWCAL